MSDEFDTPSAPAGQRPAGKKRAGRRQPQNGEKGIRYGNRNFIVTPGQMLVASRDAWHLVVVPSRCGDGWYNFKLYYDLPAPKNLFHLAIQDEEVSMRREAKMLDEYYPGVKGWVLYKALQWIDGEIELQPEKGIPVTYYKTVGWRSAPKREGK